MLGIITLDGAAVRVPGDVGHPDSYGMPVAFDVARGAGMPAILAGTEQSLLPYLVGSGRRLLARGARVVGTTCGLLTRLQLPLADELGVPVAVSSLLQLPLALATIRTDQQIALLTADAALITGERLAAAGVPDGQVDRIRIVELLDAPTFYSALTGELITLDVRRASAEITAILRQALADEPSIGGIVSECANLPPYSSALREATGLPVWDAIGQLHWLWSALPGCPEPGAAAEHYERRSS